MARKTKTKESSSNSESRSDPLGSESSVKDATADAHGLSCSQAKLAAAYSTMKRMDEKETTMALSSATLDLYFKSM
jgi:hypothetical protein